MGQNLMGPVAPSAGNFTYRLSTDLHSESLQTRAMSNQSACVTVSRWRMRSSLTDRIYVLLILILCFGFPSLIIIISYLSILMTVRM